LTILIPQAGDVEALSDAVKAQASPERVLAAASLAAVEDAIKTVRRAAATKRQSMPFNADAA
jgi:hypothetical protein